MFDLFDQDPFKKKSLMGFYKNIRFNSIQDQFNDWIRIDSISSECIKNPTEQ